MTALLVPLRPPVPEAPPPSPPATPPWVLSQLQDLSHNPSIFGTRRKSHAAGTNLAKWFYEHNFTRPHPVSNRPRYYCETNMWFLSDQLNIPLRSLQRLVRALEAYGFLRRLTVASKTGKYHTNTWQIAHTHPLRMNFSAKVLRGDTLLPP